MTDADQPSPVTTALAAIRAGDRSAKERLVELVYEDLRAAAQRVMRQERADHTLQPTALVNESLVRLLDTAALRRIEDRGHLIAAATIAFKRVLIDYARARAAQKRGGGRERRPLTEAADDAADVAPGATPPPAPETAENPFDALLAWYDEQGLNILTLDQALDEMRELEERWFDVVLLRFFGGLTIEQTAGLLDVSPRTVAHDWNQARAWLRVRLGDDDGEEHGAGTPAEGPLRGGEPPGG